jgi:putative lipoprotein
MMKAILAAALLAAPPKDGWFGVDKVKHFFMSAFVQSAAFSAARAAKLSVTNAQAVAGVTTAVVGIGREIHDKRVGRPFSVKDLTWDAAGGVAAARLLNKTR